MNQDVFKVISAITHTEFEDALNEAGADGYKIVPLTTTIRPGQYECVMGKTINAEAEATRKRAEAAGFVVPNFGEQ